MNSDIEIIRHPPQTIGHRAEPGVELWAIGDVHGRADLLHALLAAIDATPRLRDRSRVLVQTGDVIDRGHGSLRCLDLLLERDVYGILGNHEQLAICAAHTREIRWHRQGAYSLWVDQGGSDVLREAWGADWSFQAHPALIPTAFGLPRWDYVRTLTTTYRSGGLLFVHAGVDPTRPLEAALYGPWDDQSDRSPVWIRDLFLRTWGDRDREVFVVHGHTPQDNVRRAGDECGGGRLNLDLGSWATGGVRAARIVDDRVEIVDAWGEPRDAQWQRALRAALREGRT